MTVAADTLTLWHRTATDADHATWGRTALAGTRVEPARGSRGSRPGPTPSHALTAYVFADVAVSPGDRISVGASDSEAPDSGSYEVTDVRTYGLGGAFHHMEVDAR